MTAQNRSEQEAQDAKVVLGIQKDLLGVQTLSLAGQTFKPADLQKLVQSRIDAANLIVTDKAKWSSDVQAYRVLNKQVATILRALRRVSSGRGPSRASNASRKGTLLGHPVTPESGPTWLLRAAKYGGPLWYCCPDALRIGARRACSSRRFGRPLGPRRVRLQRCLLRALPRQRARGL